MKGLPEKGQQVFVIGPSGGGMNARVTDARDGATLLSFPDNESEPAAVLAGGNVAIQYTNRRGVCRLDGAAHATGTGGVLRVEHGGEVQLVQRREFVRVDGTVAVTYRPVGMTGWTGETTTVNVSGGGFMISGHEGLSLGQVMAFTLLLDGDRREGGPLDVVGKVVRETPAGLGVEIVEIDEDERDRLIRWVFARERLARQIARGS